MPTKFHLSSDDASFDEVRLQEILPADMEVDKTSEGIYIDVESSSDEDIEAQSRIDRELDRIYFLTCNRMRAEMCRRSVTKSLTCRYTVFGKIPDGTKPIHWTDKLALQLRLWQIASEADDPLIKVLLYFQIVELEYPNTRDNAAYPEYSDVSIAPDPKTEAKLLRHIVAHAGEPLQSGTKNYLDFLGLPRTLSNLTNPEWLEKIRLRIPIVIDVARGIIRNSLQAAEQKYPEDTP